MRYTTLIYSILFTSLSLGMLAQQDPQYTQYMYNTQVFNPAYAGNKETLSAGLLYRTQWVGVDGAPKTATLTLDTPIGYAKEMGLGLSVIHDEIGIAKQTEITVDYSYNVMLGYTTKLSFGVKAGLDVLDVDFTKLDIYNPNDPLFQENIDNRWQPKVGAGLYLNTDRFYAGLSIPNFLESKHFDKGKTQGFHSVASERMHYYFMAGYVFDLSHSVKFKPATMLKVVSGAPLQLDLSASFLLYDRLTLGAAWRKDAAMSALVGFQINPELFLGVGYDYQLNSDLAKHSDGSYEFILRFDIINQIERILTPRFF